MIKSNKSKEASEVEEFVSDPSVSPPSTDPSVSPPSTEASPPSTEARSPKQRLQNPAKLQASSGRKGQPVGKKETDNKSGDQSKAGAASKGGTKKTTAASSTNSSADSEAASDDSLRRRGGEMVGDLGKTYGRKTMPGARESD